ncbi:MAG: alpha/beta fold hydrolase [Mycobacteriales bacterium]|nr:alpha/beta fold hydrolase [Mycobacteriales bacterium]
MSGGPLRAAGQLAGGVSRVRPPWELARFLRSDVVAGRGVPHGDGSAVVVLPPAVTGDWYMRVMTRWLGRIGYAAHSSSIAWHVDCSDRTLAKVLPRVLALAADSGPVSLVGHSRGGLLAKAIAQSEPAAVRRVVTLAAPLAAPFTIHNLTLERAASLARSRLQRDTERRSRGCLTEACACPYGAAYRQEWPDGPRLVSLFTRSDEVVRWQSCVVPYARNVEVRGSHMGLVAARNAYVAIARALAGEYDEVGTTWQLGSAAAVPPLLPG